MSVEAQLKAPKYAQFAQQLRRQMEKGVLQPGDRLPSFAELRAKYGMSQTTFEKMHTLLERDGLIVREQGRGTFVAAQTRPKTGILGFVGNAFAMRHNSQFAALVAEGVQQAAIGQGQRILLLDGDPTMGRGQVDGVLMYNFNWEEQPPNFPEGVPYVTVMNTTDGVTAVVPDNRGGAHLAAEHLLELGHHRIACLIESPGFYVVKERIDGYLDAMRAAGIEPMPGWVREAGVFRKNEGGYREWGRASMEKWLLDPSEIGWKQLAPTALFAQNDWMAVGAMSALQDAGYCVPEEVSIVCFDSTEVCEWFTPRLTAVRVPLREIGAKAVEVLLQQIEGEAGEPNTITLPTGLDVRDSTAPPRS